MPYTPPTPVGPAVVQHHYYTAPRISASQVLAVVLLVALLGLGSHDYVAHHRPQPGPPPAPTPTPVSGTLWVTLVYDGDSPGTDFARLESDPALEEGINKLGGHLRKFTKDSSVLRDKNLTQFVDKYGVPALILQAEGTSKITASACPKSAAEVVDAARRFKEGR